MLVVIGTMTYYGVPLSFLHNNMFVGFVILSLILIMIIIGLTFMCTLLFTHLERLLLWILMTTCCRRDRRIHSIISKQMAAHQVRNNKTSIMFTLSVAFLFFSASSFEMINTLVLKGFDKVIGADIYVFAAVTFMLNEGELSNYLKEQKDADEHLIVDYAYSSRDWETSIALGSGYYDYSGIYDASQFAPTYYVWTKLYGLPRNYFDVVQSEYYVEKEAQ